MTSGSVNTLVQPLGGDASRPRSLFWFGLYARPCKAVRERLDGAPRRVPIVPVLIQGERGTGKDIIARMHPHRFAMENRAVG